MPQCPFNTCKDDKLRRHPPSPPAGRIDKAISSPCRARSSAHATDASTGSSGGLRLTDRPCRTQTGGPSRPRWRALMWYGTPLPSMIRWGTTAGRVRPSPWANSKMPVRLLVSPAVPCCSPRADGRPVPGPTYQHFLGDELSTCGQHEWYSSRCSPCSRRDVRPVCDECYVVSFGRGRASGRLRCRLHWRRLPYVRGRITLPWCPIVVPSLVEGIVVDIMLPLFGGLLLK